MNPIAQADLVVGRTIGMVPPKRRSRIVWPVTSLPAESGDGLGEHPLGIFDEVLPTGIVR